MKCLALLSLFLLGSFWSISAEEIYSNQTAQGCSYQGTCSVGGYEGACVSVSAGCCSGAVASNLCPGSSDVKCCTQAKCSTPSGAGTCMQTSLCGSQGGKSVSGYCVGPSDLQCCVKGGGSAHYGVDVSTAISTSSASCFKSSGMSFMVARGFGSNGKVDTAVCTSIINAANAGIARRDAYIFPCPTCSQSASGQLGALVDYLNGHCKSQWSGRIWLDIEGAQYWKGSYSANQQFYKQLKDACKSHGVSCGVYTAASQWQSVFGSTSFTYGNELPLWYAHWDNSASFSDWKSFGGWSSPHAKQYAGDVKYVCSMVVDRDYSSSTF